MQPFSDMTSNKPELRDQLEQCVQLATRAPSSHNSQPWRFRCADSWVELHADETRRLAVVDPHGRELLMSCGAALFSLRCALAQSGHAVRVETFPEPQQAALLARVHLQPGAADVRAAALSALLPKRQTQRAAFSAAPLPQGLCAALQAEAAAEGASLQLFASSAQRQALAELVAQGDRMQWSEVHFRSELASWMRPNDSARGDGLPGYALGLGHWLSRLAPWVVRHFDSGASQARKDRALVMHAPLLLVLATQADTPLAWLAAGQALQRVLLSAAAQGVSAGFMNQPLQCPELRPRLSGMLGQTLHAQLLFRLGHSALAKPSPRRPFSEIIDRPV